MASIGTGLESRLFLFRDDVFRYFVRWPSYRVAHLKHKNLLTMSEEEEHEEQFRDMVIELLYSYH